MFRWFLRTAETCWALDGFFGLLVAGAAASVSASIPLPASSFVLLFSDALSDQSSVHINNIDMSTVTWQEATSLPHAHLCNCIHLCTRDVNETRESRVSVFFLDPGNEISRLPRIEIDAKARQQAYCERDNCHRSLSAWYQSIACCFSVAVACIPDAQTPTPQNKGQWRI